LREFERSCWINLRLLIPTHPISANWPSDAFHRAIALIIKAQRQLAIHVIVDAVTNEYATEFGHAFQPRRHLDAVSEQVFLIRKDVAEIDADAECEPSV